MSESTEAEAPPAGPAADEGPSRKDVILFWACFASLIATAFGFIVRSLIIDEWAVEFNLTATEKGQILGVGLWPFAITIVLFSLVVDKIGYGTAMVFAFACHIVSTLITIFAQNYTMLYVGTFIVALGNGTVEAVINPVVATMFSKHKVKWLNILHAGWPGGLVLGGLIALGMGADTDWRWKVGLILIPTVFYGVFMLGKKFPVHERVAAGVSYKSMLQELGVIGALIIVALMVREIGTAFDIGGTAQIVIIGLIVIPYGIYVRSLGRPMLIFMMVIMFPLATTELGTDSWITDLMTPEMEQLGRQAGWVLVYTSFIMMMLRFFAGSIVHRISPFGLLAVGAALAAVGLYALSYSTGIMIFAAATVFAMGKTFFWPTTLGIVAERYPHGGALTLNTIAGVGMLGVGILGSVFIGNNQDTRIDKALAAANPTLHTQVVAPPQNSIFGEYSAVDQEKLAALGEEEQAEVVVITNDAKKAALRTVALLPLIMLVCYIVLIIYFRRQGGYSVVDIAEGGGGGASAST